MTTAKAEGGAAAETRRAVQKTNRARNAEAAETAITGGCDRRL
jgi:hypothetical protein